MSDTNHFGKFTGHVIAATASFLVIAVAAVKAEIDRPLMGR